MKRRLLAIALTFVMIIMCLSTSLSTVASAAQVEQEDCGPSISIYSNDYYPQGCLDSVTSTSACTISVRGWAFDMDKTSASLAIHVYTGGEAGEGGTIRYIGTANSYRADVDSVYSVGAYHGFDFSFTVAGLSGSQSVYVYAIDATDSDKHTLLGSATVSVVSDSDAPYISNVSVTNITTTSYTVSCTVSDNVGVTEVRFPTWTTLGGQDDIIWYECTLSGSTASVTIPISNHNNEKGEYNTHIYAYDASGNESLYELTVPSIPSDPKGEVDSVTSSSPGTITVCGWAYDEDDLDEPLTIHIYVGGKAGGGASLYTTTANCYRPDVEDVFGDVGAYHGFSATISVKETGTQDVYVYAINSDGGNDNNPLLGSETVTILQDTTAPSVSNIKVSDVTSDGSYTVSCTVKDDWGVDYVKMVTYIEEDTDAESISTTASLSGSTASATISLSAFGNQSGTYITYIYAYDESGNCTKALVDKVYISATTDTDTNEETDTEETDTDTTTDKSTDSEQTDTDTDTDADKTTDSEQPDTDTASDEETDSDVATVYSVVGAFNLWDVTDETTELTLNKKTGLYEITLTLDAGSYEFKVVENHSWDVSYGADESGTNVLVSVSDTGDVLITFDAATGEITYSGEYVYEITEHTYVAAGSADLFGSGWDGSDENNQLTLNEETGLYELTLSYEAEADETVEFKMVRDGATWYGVDGGDDNIVITFEEDGEYTILITFDEETMVPAYTLVRVDSGDATDTSAEDTTDSEVVDTEDTATDTESEDTSTDTATEDTPTDVDTDSEVVDTDTTTDDETDSDVADTDTTPVVGFDTYVYVWDGTSLTAYNAGIAADGSYYADGYTPAVGDVLYVVLVVAGTDAPEVQSADELNYIYTYTITAEDVDTDTTTDTDTSTDEGTDTSTDEDSDIEYVYYMLGDVSEDEAVNTLDALLILRSNAGTYTLTEKQVLESDVLDNIANGTSTEAGSLEALTILRWNAGNDVETTRVISNWYWFPEEPSSDTDSDVVDTDTTTDEDTDSEIVDTDTTTDEDTDSEVVDTDTTTDEDTDSEVVDTDTTTDEDTDSE
ncbi:MAG: GBS Bsp-like repeat-containing protein, partial [Bacteroides sp.]|nr:GBS Bsp-like repeat-containing protein [Bacteroides sp.]